MANQAATGATLSGEHSRRDLSNSAGRGANCREFMNATTQLFFYGGLVAYAAFFAGLVLWLAKLSRKGHPPFPKGEKLLRRPGQHLEERLVAMDEELFNRLMLGLLLPFVIFWLLLAALAFTPKAHWWWLFLLVLGATVTSIVVRVRSMLAWIKERRNCSLGLDGERYVADFLQPLWAKGCVIYHDVPVDRGSSSFNLDHVIVSPSKVYVIETKTRSKHAKNDAGEDHKAIFDGTRILWPGGSFDVDSLRQADANAQWLRKWLRDRLALDDVPVQAFVTYPGWWVELTKWQRDGANPLNPKQIAKAIDLKKVLDQKTFEQICKQLDSVCRTARLPE